MNKNVVLVAGGTGGHINAALAIGREFEKNSFITTYISGQRYLDYQILKNLDSQVYNLNSMALRFKDPVKIIKSFFINLVLLFKVMWIFIIKRPRYVIGTGGYICGPVLLAAKILKIQTAIVEQNAVMGMTNRMLKSISDQIFVNFENTKYLKNTRNVHITGNPISSSIKWCEHRKDGKLNILVFGGSLGASQINECIFDLIENAELVNVEIVHQVGRGGVNSKLSMKSPIKYHQLEYIDNMQEAYSKADLIICRCGASTISELEVVQRPSVLIPYLYASDNHQYYNAREYQDKNLAYTKIIDSKLNTSEMGNLIEETIKDVQSIKPEKQSSSKQKSAAQKIYKLIVGKK